MRPWIPVILYLTGQGQRIFSLPYSSIPTFTDCKPQEENEYCYVFYEPNNNELDTTVLAYEWDLGDGTKIRKLKAEHCYSKTGNYLVQLNVVDLLTNQVALNQASDSFLVEDIEQPYITASDTVSGRAGAYPRCAIKHS